MSYKKLLLSLIVICGVKSSYTISLLSENKAQIAAYLEEEHKVVIQKLRKIYNYTLDHESEFNNEQEKVLQLYKKGIVLPIRNNLDGIEDALHNLQIYKENNLSLFCMLEKYVEKIFLINFAIRTMEHKEISSFCNTTPMNTRYFAEGFFEILSRTEEGRDFFNSLFSGVSEEKEFERKVHSILEEFCSQEFINMMMEKKIPFDQIHNRVFHRIEEALKALNNFECDLPLPESKNIEAYRNLTHRSFLTNNTRGRVYNEILVVGNFFAAYLEEEHKAASQKIREIYNYKLDHESEFNNEQEKVLQLFNEGIVLPIRQNLDGIEDVLHNLQIYKENNLSLFCMLEKYVVKIFLINFAIRTMEHKDISSFCHTATMNTRYFAEGFFEILSRTEEGRDFFNSLFSGVSEEKEFERKVHSILEEFCSQEFINMMMEKKIPFDQIHNRVFHRIEEALKALNNFECDLPLPESKNIEACVDLDLVLHCCLFTDNNRERVYEEKLLLGDLSD